MEKSQETLMSAIKNAKWKSVESDNVLLGMKCANLNKLVYSALDPLQEAEEQEAIHRMKIEGYKVWQVRDEGAVLESLKESGLAITGVLSNVCPTVRGPIPFVCFRGTKTFSDVLSDVTSAQIAEFISRKGTTVGKTGMGMLNAYCLLRDIDILYHKEMTSAAEAEAFSSLQAKRTDAVSMKESTFQYNPRYTFREKEISQGLLDFVLYQSRLYGNRLLITGHSLGGALASLLAAEIWTDHLDDYHLIVVTFGSPRVFDGETAVNLLNIVNRSQSRALRFVNHGDVIAHIGKVGAFEHVETKEVEKVSTADIATDSQLSELKATGPEDALYMDSPVKMEHDLNSTKEQDKMSETIAATLKAVENVTSVLDFFKDSRSQSAANFLEHLLETELLRNVIVKIDQLPDTPITVPVKSAVANSLETTRKYLREVAAQSSLMTLRQEGLEMEISSQKAPEASTKDHISPGEDLASPGTPHSTSTGSLGELDETTFPNIFPCFQSNKSEYNVLEDAAEVINFIKKVTEDPNVKEKVAKIFDDQWLAPAKKHFGPDSELKKTVGKLFSLDFPSFFPDDCSEASHSTTPRESECSPRDVATREREESGAREQFNPTEMKKHDIYRNLETDMEEEETTTKKVQFVALNHPFGPHFFVSGDCLHLCSEEHYDWAGSFTVAKDAVDLANFVTQLGGPHRIDSSNGYIAQFLKSKIYQDAVESIDDTSLKESFTVLPICKV